MFIVDQAPTTHDPHVMSTSRWAWAGASHADQSALEQELEAELWCALADSALTPELPLDLLPVIAASDPARMSPRARLAMVRLTERAMAVISATQQKFVSAISVEAVALASADDANTLSSSGGLPIDQPEREQIAVALRVAPRTAGVRVNEAVALTTRLPELFDEVASGRISMQHARVIVDETAPLPPEQAQEVAREVVPLAQRAAVGVVRRRTALLAARVDPTLTERHAEAVTQRRVILQPEADGMASITIYDDAALCRQMYDEIDRLAREIQQPGQSIDSARADATSTLVLDPTAVITSRGYSIATVDSSLRGSKVSRSRSSISASGNPNTGNPNTSTGPIDPSPARGPLTPSSNRRRPRVAVEVDLPTLLGLADNPAHVRALGPIPARVARALATEGDLRRLVTDPVGRLIEVSPHTYRPGDALAELVQARDRTCCFPHCAQPAHLCDLDHIEPFNHEDPAQGGPTTADNLQTLCRRHHRLKTAGTWQVRRLDNGHLQWTGPSGEVVEVEPGGT